MIGCGAWHGGVGGIIPALPTYEVIRKPKYSDCSELDLGYAASR